MFNRRRITAALIGLLVLVLGGWLVKDVVSGDTPATPTSEHLRRAHPPRAARPCPARTPGCRSRRCRRCRRRPADTWKLIEKGGPYPYPRNDDVVFENREKRLPRKQSGYYHEYTVKTPGSADRGARRLITGQAHELYYTGDHYASFVVVDPAR